MSRSETIKLALAGLLEVIDPGSQNLELSVVELNAQSDRIVTQLSEAEIAELVAPFRPTGTTS